MNKQDLVASRPYSLRPLPRIQHIPLCVAFVDYEKAFDSVQTQAILTSLQEQGIEDVYIEILTGSSVSVNLHKESGKIRIKRGVRPIGVRDGGQGAGGSCPPPNSGSLWT